MEKPETGIGARYGVWPAVLFHLLSILTFPATLAGYLIWAGAAVLGGRASGVSGSAQGPLAARFSQHNLGTRDDPVADRLIRVLPGVPALGVSLSTGPTFWAHRLTGYVPCAFRYPFEGEVSPMLEASARQTFFDNVVARHLAEIKQFVILGAGFDTRAYGLQPKLGIRSFELDAPKTQAIKRRILQSAGIDTAGITFVAADFERQDWFGQLVSSGFEPRRKALFLLEGVIIYLEPEAVQATFRRIAGCASGSAVAFDYLTTEPLVSSNLYWRYGRMMTNIAGEPVKFGLDSRPPVRGRLSEFLRGCGLALGELRVLGREGTGKRSWGGFATAVVP